MTADLVRRYLASDEPLEAVATGTLLDDAGHESVSIGMTDRRFLCVSDAETFVSVGFDDVSSVRSRRRTRTTVAGTDYRLLMVLGGILAVLGYVGVFALGPGSLAPALTLAAAGCLVVAHSLRRDGTDVEWEPLREYASEVIASVGGIDAARRTGRQIAVDLGDADNDQLLLVASTVLGAVAFLGVVLLAAHALVPLFALVTVGGAILAGEAYHRRADFEELAVVQQNERVVNVDTTGGRTVSVRIDPEAEIDRRLCRVAYADRAIPSTVRSAPN